MSRSELFEKKYRELSLEISTQIGENGWQIFSEIGYRKPTNDDKKEDIIFYSNADEFLSDVSKITRGKDESKRKYVSRIISDLNKNWGDSFSFVMYPKKSDIKLL